MKYFLFYSLILLFPIAALGDIETITWKGTYYHATPIKQGITKKYCQDHTPGTFIHTVKSALTQPIMTDKGIKLDHATFNSEKLGRVYLLHGKLIASGKTGKLVWRDRIHYMLYKVSEAGETKGIWYSKECKGLYRGVAIR